MARIDSVERMAIAMLYSLWFAVPVAAMVLTWFEVLPPGVEMEALPRFLGTCAVLAPVVVLAGPTGYGLMFQYRMLNPVGFLLCTICTGIGVEAALGVIRLVGDWLPFWQGFLRGDDGEWPPFGQGFLCGLVVFGCIWIVFEAVYAVSTHLKDE